MNPKIRTSEEIASDFNKKVEERKSRSAQSTQKVNLEVLTKKLLTIVNRQISALAVASLNVEIAGVYTPVLLNDKQTTALISYVKLVHELQEQAKVKEQEEMDAIPDSEIENELAKLKGDNND